MPTRWEQPCNTIAIADSYLQLRLFCKIVFGGEGGGRGGAVRGMGPDPGDGGGEGGAGPVALSLAWKERRAGLGSLHSSHPHPLLPPPL